jgi:predicted Zn-dependent protease
MKILITFLLFSQIMEILKKEIKRNYDYLNENFEIKPYFILYRLDKVNFYYLKYSDGNFTEEKKTISRIPYVELRVGDYKNDGVNTKFPQTFLTNEDFQNFLYPKLPIEDDEEGIKNVFWKITDFAYKNAVSDFYEKKRKETAFFEEDTSYSFSKEEIGKYEEKINFEMDDKNVKRNFEKFLKGINSKGVYNFKIHFYKINIERIILNTEGTEILKERDYFLLKIEIFDFDKEGKYYQNSREFFGYKISEILNEENLKEINKFFKDFKEYVNGEEIKEYKGDLILRGISSAKFISNLVKNNLILSKENYEILKNFFEKINKKITGNIKIYDKPDIRYFNGKPLSGYLVYDDEGVKGKEVILIDNGILKNFLLKREPVYNFSNSNGHARCALYSKPFPFITNLFIYGEEKEEIKDSILILEDIEFKSPLSFEVKKGFISYKNGNKKEIKNIIFVFSSFEEMWEKIKGASSNLNSYNFFEENPYIPFSITCGDIFLSDVYGKRILKKRIKNGRY